MLRKKIYSNRREYCAIVSPEGKPLKRYDGNFISVGFEWKYLLELFLSKKVGYLLHSHPYFVGTNYSELDRKVFESWAITTGQPIVHKITNFRWVTTYRVSAAGDIKNVGTRQIGIVESLTNWPWGVRL